MPCSPVDQQVDGPEGKVLQIETVCVAYVQSLAKVAGLLAQGQQDEAVALMSSETLPLRNDLQHSVLALVQLQNSLATHAAAQSHAIIVKARSLMLTLGAVALLLGIACAYAITRSITFSFLADIARKLSVLECTNPKADNAWQPGVTDAPLLPTVFRATRLAKTFARWVMDRAPRRCPG